MYVYACWKLVLFISLGHFGFMTSAPFYWPHCLSLFLCLIFNILFILKPFSVWLWPSIKKSKHFPLHIAASNFKPKVTITFPPLEMVLSTRKQRYEKHGFAQAGIFKQMKLESSSISPDLCCFQSSHLVFSLERCGVPDKLKYTVGINPERFRMAVLQEASQISLES